MHLAIGQTYFRKQLAEDLELNKLYIIYPRFFDDKRTLLSGKGYSGYIVKLWEMKNKIEYAVYPDYVHELLFVPKSTTYIYVIHDFDADAKAYFQLKQHLNLIAGFPSDDESKNYSIDEFIERFKNEKKWYLGVSARWRLKQAIEYQFDYADITLMALGSFKDIKKYERVRQLLFEFYRWKEELEKEILQK